MVNTWRCGRQILGSNPSLDQELTYIFHAILFSPFTSEVCGMNYHLC